MFLWDKLLLYTTTFNMSNNFPARISMSRIMNKTRHPQRYLPIIIHNHFARNSSELVHWFWKEDSYVKVCAIAMFQVC